MEDKMKEMKGKKVNEGNGRGRHRKWAINRLTSD